MAVRIEREAEPIPGYKLIERLGGGGFGEVWKVTAPGGLLKAIKFVYGDLETTTEEGQRAEQELKALSRVKTVRHPYLLSLERYDIIDGQLLIVMELADRNLWDRFRECKTKGLPGIPREELLRYMTESAEALDLMNILHQLQHLDIKPQNLFLVHNHVKVADFGLVKDLHGVMASVTGGITPVYAAPETYDGWVSRFCDQYSLAIVYQELLSGHRPFNGNNVRQLILQHLQMPPDLSALPPYDREAVGRALSKSPDERFPSCMEFILALRGDGQPAPAPLDSQKLPVPASLESQANPPEALPAHQETAGISPATPEKDGGRAQPWVEQVLSASDPELDLASELAAISAGLSTRWIRVPAGATPETTDTPSEPLAPPEIQGDGSLFPALVIGLGALGLDILKRLREQIQEQFVTLDALPQVRLLYLDTDLEAARAISRGNPAAELASIEIVHAKLNRPSHYMRSKKARSTIDSWLSQKMLYRIPRTPVTTGLRSLGRLAFFDHYPMIIRRLATELKACTDPDALKIAARKTGLGLRSNRPRVYVATGLGGGTGSGIFLDLAYVVRRMLKQRGYEQPEIIGLFLLPPVDRQPGRARALGNTFAALTELHHFSSPRTVFSAQYEPKGLPMQDPDPPYSRCKFLFLPGGDAEDQMGPIVLPATKAITLAGDFIFNDLATPLGRAADQARAACQDQSGRGKRTRYPQHLWFETFGISRISWPRLALLRNVARRLCGRLVQSWLSKDASPVRDAVGSLVAELWAQHQLSGEQLMARLQKSCERMLDLAPEASFAAISEQLSKLDVQNLEQLPAALQAALQRLEQLVGRGDVIAGAQPPAVVEPLRMAADKLIAEHGVALAGAVAALIERPEFRLAGAEEAVRQLIATLEQELAHFEPLAKELAAQATEAYTRIESLLASLRMASPGNKKLEATITNLFDLLRVYPRWRYQSLILQRFVAIYVSLRGGLSDQLREINFCRTRLTELRRSFEDTNQDAVAIDDGGIGRNIYPAGCRTLEEAVQQSLRGVLAEEMGNLAGRIQQLIHLQFKGLGHVCLTAVNLMSNVETAMQREVERFLEKRISEVSIAEMYLAQQGEDQQIRDELAEAFKQAAPELPAEQTSQQPEIRILGTPAGPAGERIREHLQQALPEIDWATASPHQDIVFYREIPHLPLSDLEQLGPMALEAYRQMSSVEHFTPHSRTDILVWRAPVGDRETSRQADKQTSGQADEDKGQHQSEVAPELSRG